MYYKADVYRDSRIIDTLVAGSLELLRDKAESYIKDDKVTHIIASEVTDIGFFKMNDEMKEMFGEEFIL